MYDAGISLEELKIDFEESERRTTKARRWQQYLLHCYNDGEISMAEYEEWRGAYNA